MQFWWNNSQIRYKRRYSVFLQFSPNNKKEMNATMDLK